MRDQITRKHPRQLLSFTLHRLDHLRFTLPLLDRLQQARYRDKNQEGLNINLPPHLLILKKLEYGRIHNWKKLCVSAELPSGKD